MTVTPTIPRAFISSVYREPGIPGSELHFQIRRRIRDIGRETGLHAWIAEYEGVKPGEWTDNIDQCVDNLIASDFFVAVLASRSGNPLGLASPYGFAATSVLEIELFYASLQFKPSYFFVVRGYEPEPELENLIRILRLHETGGNWFVGTENEIDERIRELFTAIVKGRRADALLPNFCDLTSGFRSFKEVEQEIRSEKLSLIGRLAPRDAADYSSERIAFLIQQAVAAQSRTAQLSRLWLALRELSKRGFDVSDGLAVAQWRDLAARLPTISAWLGLHGPMNIGVMAAYQTQNQLRRHGVLPAHEFPYGAFASESYSIGLNHAKRGWKRLRFQAAERLATRHVDLHPDNPSNALTIRGHVRLRLASLGAPWNVWTGLGDFRKALDIRERLSPDRKGIGESLFNLGLAEYHISRFLLYNRRTALAKMREGIADMETNLNRDTVGFIVSAQRKFIEALEKSGLRDEAAVYRQKATALARQYGVLDQLRRLPSAG